MLELPAGGGGYAAWQPLRTQARSFNTTLVWQFSAPSGYMPAALRMLYWYRAWGRQANGPPQPVWDKADLLMHVATVLVLAYFAS